VIARRRSPRGAELIGLAPVVLMVLLLFGGALGVTLGQSLGRLPLIGEPAWSLEAYADVLGRRDFLTSLGYSLWLATASTLGATFVGVSAALLLRGAFRGRRLVLSMVQLALPVPYSVAAVMMLLALAQSGLLARVAYHAGWIAAPSDMPALLFDRLAFGVIATYVWKGGVFVLVIVLAALRRTGDAAESVARTLGAPAHRRLWHVTLPAVAPQIGTAAALVFAFTFGAFEVPFLLGRTAPQALPVLAWRAFGDLDLGRRDEAAAVGVLVALVAVGVLGAGRWLANRLARSDTRRPLPLQPSAAPDPHPATWKPRRPEMDSHPDHSLSALDGPLRGRRLAGTAAGWGLPLGRWLLVAMAVLPLLPLLGWSLAGAWRWPDLWPDPWSADAWRSVLDPGGRAMGALSDSLRVSSLCAMIALLVSLPAGRALARPWRGRGGVEALLLAPALVPPVAVAMGLQTAFSRLGVIDTVLAVALAHLVPVLPYVTLLVAAAFRRLSPEWEAQARTLGAGRWSRWRYVTLPLLGPSVAVAGIFGFMVSWSQYLSTLMIGGGRVVTLPLQLYAYVGAGQHARASALACLFLAPPLLLLGLLARPLAGDDVAADGMGRL
jgi:ABC-type spermidine/putrescine transport system permease subunit II